MKNTHDVILPGPLLICFAARSVGALRPERGQAQVVGRVSAAGTLLDAGNGWHTLEELEELQAAEAAARYPLSNTKLRALAVKYKPPQSWYDETRKPF